MVTWSLIFTRVENIYFYEKLKNLKEVIIMFERIKCYRNLRKAEKYLRGAKKLGEITHDEEMIRGANEALYTNAILKKKMWFNRKIAENYNMEILKRGF